MRNSRPGLSEMRIPVLMAEWVSLSCWFSIVSLLKLGCILQRLMEEPGAHIGRKIISHEIISSYEVKHFYAPLFSLEAANILLPPYNKGKLLVPSHPVQSLSSWVHDAATAHAPPHAQAVHLQQHSWPHSELEVYPQCWDITSVKQRKRGRIYCLTSWRFQFIVFGNDAEPDGENLWHGGQEAEREGPRTRCCHHDLSLPPVGLPSQSFHGLSKLLHRLGTTPSRQDPLAGQTAYVNPIKDCGPSSQHTSSWAKCNE